MASLESPQKSAPCLSTGQMSCKPNLTIPELPTIIDYGPQTRAIFRQLQCRGFSYSFVPEPNFRIGFPRRVNLRFALLLPKNLNHPLRVNKALRYDRCRHVTSEYRRCAAFALGTSRIEGTHLMWYIYTLQSDLALSKRPALRDYLRGWRKVLFACIANMAITRGVEKIFLSPSDEIFRAAFMGQHLAGQQVPSIWRAIYDRTAEEFGMKKVTLTVPVNIQMLPRRKPCLSLDFYRICLD